MHSRPSSPQDVNKTFPRDPESPDCARESERKQMGSWKSAPGHSRKLQGGSRDRLKSPKTALGYSRNHDSYAAGPEGGPGTVRTAPWKPPVSLSTAPGDEKCCSGCSHKQIFEESQEQRRCFVSQPQNKLRICCQGIAKAESTADRKNSTLTAARIIFWK